jgi:two-component system response regulator HydG
MITVDDLPAVLRVRKPAQHDPVALALARGLTLDELERDYIQRVVAAEGGNKTRAAQRLGLDRKTLYRKLEEYAAEEEPTPTGPPTALPASSPPDDDTTNDDGPTS